MEPTNESTQGERAPLLQAGPYLGDPLPASHTPHPATSLPTIMYYMMILILVPTSFSIAEASQIRFFESTICKNYYREHDPSMIGPEGWVPEKWCKKSAIQETSTYVQSWQPTVNLAASFVASFHTSLLLLSQGRKFVLTLNLAGHLGSLLTKYIILYCEPRNVEWTWASSIFLLLAGGGEWRQEILFMILGDATFRGDNLEDTFTVFSFEQVVAGGAAWASMHLGSRLMTTYSIDVPMAIGWVVIVIMMILVQFMTEKPTQDGTDDNLTGFPKIKEQFRITFDCLLISREVRLLVLTYLVSNTFGQLTNGSVFQQYVSKQFGKTIAQASELQADSTLLNAMFLILWAVFCGKLAGSHFVQDQPLIATVASFRFRSNVKNINISRIAAIAQAAGFLIIGLWPVYPALIAGLVLCALGQPYRIATRCALMNMTHASGRDNTTGLFSAITMMDMIGGAAVAPLLGKMFRLSLQHGGIFLGLPFFLAAILLASVAVVVFLTNATAAQTLESSGSSTLEADSSATSTVRPGTPLEAPKSPDNDADL